MIHLNCLSSTQVCHWRKKPVCLCIHVQAVFPSVSGVKECRHSPYTENESHQLKCRLKENRMCMPWIQSIAECRWSQVGVAKPHVSASQVTWTKKDIKNQSIECTAGWVKGGSCHSHLSSLQGYWGCQISETASCVTGTSVSFMQWSSGIVTMLLC